LTNNFATYAGININSRGVIWLENQILTT